MKVFRPAELGLGIAVQSTGAYVPEHRVRAADLAAAGCPLTEAEITRLCGVQERRWAAEDEATSDLAIAACRDALTRAGMTAAHIDRLVLATVSPDRMSPSAACFVQHGLGLRTVPAYDLTASCSGFLFALDNAARAIATGDQHVLACAADVRSRFLDPTDRATSALFGDGAGAAVVSRGPVGRGLIAIGLATDGRGVDSVYVPAGGSREPASRQTVAERRHAIRMEHGPSVYLHAIDGMLRVADALLDSAGLTRNDVYKVVPHQANLRLLRRLARRAGWSEDDLVINVDRYGNVSGASCALALHDLLTGSPVPDGAPILLVAAGAGHTAGGAILIP